MSKHYDVIIIGGGFSGCSAAIRLAQEGFRVGLFEAGRHLGGRAGSFELSIPALNGQKQMVDFGQHVFLKAYRKTSELLRALGTWEKVYFPRRLEVGFLNTLSPTKVMDFQASSLPAPMHLAWGVARYSFLSVSQRMKALMGCRKLFSIGTIPPEWDQRTVGDWLRDELGQPDDVIRGFWEPMVLATMNETVERASLFLFLHVLKEGFWGSASDSRIGYSTVPLRQLLEPSVETLLKKLGSDVYRSSRVVSVTIRDGGGWVVRTDQDQWHCSQVISAGNLHDRTFMGKDSNDEVVPTSAIVNLHIWMDSNWTWPFGEKVQIGLIHSPLQWLFYPAAIPYSQFPLQYVTGTISAFDDSCHRQGDLKKSLVEEVKKCHPSFDKITDMKVIVEKRATFSSAAGLREQRMDLYRRLNRGGLVMAGDWTHASFPSTIESACEAGLTAAEQVSTWLRRENRVST